MPSMRALCASQSNTQKTAITSADAVCSGNLSAATIEEVGIESMNPKADHAPS
jgi:hypothetical protein